MRGLIGLILAVGAAPVLATDLESLRDCVRANFPQESFQQSIRLTAVDRAGGERELVAELYGTQQGEERFGLVLQVEQPADLANARYLLLARDGRDDMYVYLPAVNRSRRIVGSMRGQPLWGTDFSYEDIKQLQGAMIDSPAEYVGQSTRADRLQHQVTVTPAAEEESPYSRIELVLDDASCLVTETRFYDDAGLAKRMHSDPGGFRRLDARWAYQRVEMKNLRDQTTSVLELGDLSYDPRLPRGLFHPKTFHIAH